MKQQLSCIMLIDNNPDDNFYHRRVINKFNASIQVIVFTSAIGALNHLFSAERDLVQPNLILLDINMPGMNGWDFMDVFQADPIHSEKTKIIVLTTSENPDDRLKALGYTTIADFMTKPLTTEKLAFVFDRFFV
jgi:CheY-like chemotaxis protein